MRFNYNSRRWRLVRAEAFARDGRKCRRCGKRWGRFEVDRIVPLKRGGDLWALGNLQTLCVSCHIEKDSA